MVRKWLDFLTDVLAVLARCLKFFLARSLKFFLARSLKFFGTFRPSLAVTAPGFPKIFQAVSLAHRNAQHKKNNSL
ncbi:MAG: hypothetical protein KBS53_06090 [Bacteroidales bacterium]|nr:hypothetical protein [Candidatus Hennigimonas equi]